MKYLSFDCAIKNCGWAYVEDKEESVNVINFGLLNFSKVQKKEMCDDFKISLNIPDCEVNYCCEKHTKGLELPNKKKKTLTSQEVCKNLINELKELEFINDKYIVILENQPSFMNPVSKSIQVMLLTYFTSLNKVVVIQNPNQKLFGFKIEKNKKYKERKTLSTYLVKNLICKSDFSKLLQFDKTDDICDAILMCYCQISSKKKNIIDDINKIIEEYKKK